MTQGSSRAIGSTRQLLETNAGTRRLLQGGGRAIGSSRQLLLHDRMTHDSYSEKPNAPEAGAWVLLCGFPECIPMMYELNNSLGLVLGEADGDGRVPVEVDCDGTTVEKKIFSQYLEVMALTDVEIALLATMDRPTQWKYMRPYTRVVVRGMGRNKGNAQRRRANNNNWNSYSSFFAVPAP